MIRWARTIRGIEITRFHWICCLFSTTSNGDNPRSAFSKDGSIGERGIVTDL